MLQETVHKWPNTATKGVNEKQEIQITTTQFISKDKIIQRWLVSIHSASTSINTFHSIDALQTSRYKPTLHKND